MRVSWLRPLYVQVIIGIMVDAGMGLLWPGIAVTLHPMADGFIKLIKMPLAPVSFATVVLVTAKMCDIKEVGRIGVRAPGWPSPLAATVLLLGVDRFMNDACAVVNLIGNSLATIAVARRDNALDLDRLRQAIAEQRGELPSSNTADVGRRHHIQSKESSDHACR